MKKHGTSHSKLKCNYWWQPGWMHVFIVLIVQGVLLCSCEGRASMPGLFGFGGGNNNNKNDEQRERPSNGERGPPPPHFGQGQPQGALSGQTRRPPFLTQQQQGGVSPPPLSSSLSQNGRPGPQRQPPQPPLPPNNLQQRQQFHRPPEIPPPPPQRRDVLQSSSSSPLKESSPNVEDAVDDAVAEKEEAATDETLADEVVNDEVETNELGNNETSTATNDERSEENDESQNNYNMEANNPFPPPPPPPPVTPHESQWLDPREQTLSSPPESSQQGWMGPPPPPNYNNEWNNGGWPQQQQQQHMDPNHYGNYPGMHGPPMYIQEELEMSLAREHDLVVQVQNLTDLAGSLQQREGIHLRQLDVLTERIMDVESQAAAERNRLLETEANCTALGMALATLEDELSEWQQRCSDMKQLREQDEDIMSDLKQNLKEKSSEAEDLAIAIENLRLVEKVKGASHSRGKQKTGGLFSWIFGFLLNDDSEYEEVTREDAYELGKSTLLRALQTERSSVHELESVVASLQQNNSAISEMVDSRDMIIDELNNRIAVFEEDKVVLKAALRQLQKEMQEEAPKAQKLMDDLAKSRKEVKRLDAEINSIIKTHQNELNSLQKTIWTKQKAINETESNLTAIGTYVDKLEERLTSFAITRRDMEEREKKCRAIEESASKAEAETKIMKAKVEDYTKQQEDLKKLLEELALERANLQKENRKLHTEREFRLGEEEQLQAMASSLEAETQRLTASLNEYKTEVDALKISLDAVQSTNSELREQTNRMENLELELGKSRQENMQLQNDYQQTRNKLEAELEKSQNEVEQLRMNAIKLMAIREEGPRRVNSERGGNMKQQEGATPPQPRPRVVPMERNVPFRDIRKKMSKATGIHGLLTPSSKMEQHLRFLHKSRTSSPSAPAGQDSQETEETETTDVVVTDDGERSDIPPPPPPQWTTSETPQQDN